MARSAVVESALSLEAAPVPVQVEEETREESASRRRPIGRRMLGSRWFPALIGLVLAGICWEIAAALNPHLVPTGPAVAGQLGEDPLFYLRNSAATFEVMMVGFWSAFAIAFVLAVVMVHMDFVERLLMPLIVILKVTPAVAIAPALVVAFGFGMLPKYIVAGLIVFFQLLVSTLMGLRSVDPLAMDVAKTLHASKLDVLWTLRLPYSLPFVFSAVKVCLPISVIGAVVAEYNASGFQRGLGSAIQLSAIQGNLAQTYACIACLAAMGLALSFLVGWAEKFLLSWHPSTAHH